MREKSVGLTVVWWMETIVSLRVLLFSIPVLLNKNLANSFVLSDLNDRFIAVLTTTALLYCIVGIASILGFKFWKATQYIAMIAALLLTVGSLYVFDQPSASVSWNYFTPVIFATVVTALAGFLGRKK